MRINKKAFTFIELIIVTVILSILATIWISKYMSTLPDSRDAQRIADISASSIALKTYKQQKWVYPIPWLNTDYFKILNWTRELAIQWKLNKNVILPTLDNIPTDPKNNLYYFYSITKNRWEFQIANTLENWWYQKTLLKWDFKSVSKNILPSILLATWSTSENTITSVDISNNDNKKLFILNWSTLNMPYMIGSWVEAYHDNTITFDEIFTENTVDFWQNSAFRTCAEIKEAWKSVGDWEYQILSNTWTLTNTWCISM